MNGLEKFDREQLETWITMCDEKFDALKVPDNQGGALLSISGRLGTYIESNAEKLAAKDAELSALRERVEALETKNEIMEDALQEIANWSDAYPLEVFPEPDFKKVRELLEAGGITVDSVSASNMRYVVLGVGRIAKTALQAP